MNKDQLGVPVVIQWSHYFGTVPILHPFRMNFQDGDCRTGRAGLDIGGRPGTYLNAAEAVHETRCKLAGQPFTERPGRMTFGIGQGHGSSTAWGRLPLAASAAAAAAASFAVRSYVEIMPIFWRFMITLGNDA